MLLTSVEVFSSANSAVTSLAGKRLQVISTGTPRVYVYDVELDGGCTHKIPVLLLGGSDKNVIGKELYSALLMAKASGKKVLLQSNHCWKDYSTPVITSLYIHD